VTNANQGSSFELRSLSPGLSHRRPVADEVRESFQRSPMELPTKYLYAIDGSDIFDKITDLPEYYVSRAETEALTDAVSEIASLGSWARIVEIGAGFSKKTRILLDAFGSRRNITYAPFDISDGALTHATTRLALEYPTIEICAYVGDFLTEDLEVALREGHGNLVLFLGATLGNFTFAERGDFYRRFARASTESDALLIGVDLVKDPNVIEAAYNDAAGVTAEFNLNAIRFLQRELGANITTEDFEHRAVYLPRHQVVEMRLYARRPLTITFTKGDLPSYAMAQGSYILTELSYKFTREGVNRDLQYSGLRLTGWWMDSMERTALALVSI